MRHFRRIADLDGFAGVRELHGEGEGLLAVLGGRFHGDELADDGGAIEGLGDFSGLAGLAELEDFAAVGEVDADRYFGVVVVGVFGGYVLALFGYLVDQF